MCLGILLLVIRKEQVCFYRIWENESVPNHSNLLGVQHDLWVKEMKILNRLRKWGGL